MTSVNRGGKRRHQMISAESPFRKNHSRGNYIHIIDASSLTTRSSNRVASDYKPLTGQLVCPDHPMQNPHLREGEMLPSASISRLSNPESKLDSIPKKEGAVSDGTW
eukprot:CAMPEP_0168204762 /NCGR_PEP_ID=MMETSP0140_2-20121125/6_1 /TAXON_ID=44445 /ORGANISM="Pseudo-nitzschia australis, Strain 10249 10 AB" /LENGTH=106 /DNA_ID=CAMNT_0008130711 /DNA_START=561 /DNA_END=878 /DNA_ORIENTATION=+